MSLTSKKLAEIILAIVAIALIVGVVLCFTTPLGDAFSGIFRKQHEVANGDIWNQGNYDIPYTVKLKTNMAEGGTVEFTGEYAGLTSLQLRGEQTVTLKATPNTGYQFTGWYVGDTQVSTDAEYTYTVNGAISIEAQFSQAFGLYQTGTNYTELTYDWDYLIANGYITVSDGTITGSNSFLSGDLLLPTDGSITSIGYQAFYGCTSLTSIVIPDSVTSIGAHAFYQNNLTSVEFGENSQLTTIGAYVFVSCERLTGIEIPSSVTSIGNHAFDGCTGLATITVESGNTVYHATGNCLIETASKNLIAGGIDCEIPTDGSVTTIGDMAFNGRVGLTSVEIPDGVTSIGEQAFYACTGLTSVEIPASVTSIGNMAFNGCTGLANVYYKGTAQQWCNIQFTNTTANPCNKGAALYFGNDLADEITIPDGVTSIGDYAFWGCSSLKKITISASVTKIGFAAFRGCTNLDTINYSGTTAQWNAITKGNQWNTNVPATEVVCSGGTVALS